MHIYEGYKHKPYGAGTRQHTPSRAELERRYTEAHASQAEPKPHREDKLPVMIAVVSVLVAIICTGAWAFGYDMLAPLLACIVIQTGGIAYGVLR